MGPLRLLFGNRRATNAAQQKVEAEDDEDALSAVVGHDESVVFHEEALNEVYFMNPGFGSEHSRALSVSPVTSFGLRQRQLTRRMSSRLREHRRIPSVDASEIDIDVVMAPSAFAFHNIPSGIRGNSFCSRDDSEIATRTFPCASSDVNRSFNRLGATSPHVNALFQHQYSFDDSEVASCTMEKPIRLRRMGSAMSYRLELSGTPDLSACDEDECSTMVSGLHSRRKSDVPELASFKERNKMIRLESLIGGVERSDRSVLEFGIFNTEHLPALQEQPTPRLFRNDDPKSGSRSLKVTDILTNDSLAQKTELPPTNDSAHVPCFPISFLSNIAEEEDESELEFETDEAQIKLEKDEDALSESDRSSLTLPTGCDIIRSSFRVRMPSPEPIQKAKFENPAFEDSAGESSVPTSPKARPKVPMLRLQSMKRRNKSKGQSDDMFLNAPRRRTEKRDESLHFALMERYLLESVVNKYLVE